MIRVETLKLSIACENKLSARKSLRQTRNIKSLCIGKPEMFNGAFGIF
jgi:hypothetical protein